MQFSINISKPKKILEGDLAGMYTCEVYLGEGKRTPFYSDNPDEVISNANKFIKVYFQQKISRLENYLKEKDIRKKLTEELE